MHPSLNPVVIPDSVAVSRRPNPRNPVEPEAMARFDGKTLFYDVFVDDQRRRLVAIGPPALNLADYVDAMTLSIDGREVAFQRQEWDEQRLSLLTAALPAAATHRVTFSFADFTTTLDLAGDGEAPPPRNVLAAISKNNRTRWISEWVDFYRARYPLDAIYLYDNGSDNVDELETVLAGRAQVIRWHFPYGPPGKVFNKFAQAGALNHCLRRFVGRGVLFNFDIDELLIADPERILADVARQGTLYFDSYNVPYVTPASDDYSYGDFCHRYAQRKTTARKFICRAEAVDVISQHNTWRYRGPRFWKRLKRNKPDTRTSRDGHFLHFLGITTNWQPWLNKLEPVSPQDLVFDDSHCRGRTDP
ncbi:MULTISPECIES: glycosyltransferase family 92 protein [unclassified Modicisalibacter]|uniref:glycosyltransferase family 92 protein n=1 Tax=unclassified Modicisalibacter TaxID=2679913 RepID=UPI001CCD5C1F|nr:MULTISPECIES: glycosyltransferase family 92 protein [unclassified Modicisalibacter]MBZ9558639.1 glycosyltransferase family 92 protein [Modicisalibacter sp. R2A 31.J]MBZ9575469.1 glycosyltransferase family 92 protein [Modicisalibacter sp. MOD 31.J]